MILLHGFLSTWRTWELMLPALERRHDVLALTMAGHAGGPRLAGGIKALADAAERAMDEAGFETAHPSATRSAATSRSGSPPVAAPGRSSH